MSDKCFSGSKRSAAELQQCTKFGVKPHFLNSLTANENREYWSFVKVSLLSKSQSALAKWVKIPDEEKEYEATPCLNILSLNEGSKVRYNNFLKFWGSVNSDSTRAKLLELEEFSKHEDDCIYYYVSKRENVFYNSMNKAIAIADVFLCLCSYINSISGKVEYVMVSPEFIIPVFK